MSKMVDCTKEDMGNVAQLYKLTIGVSRMADSTSAVGVKITEGTTNALIGLTNGFINDTTGLKLPNVFVTKLEALQSAFVKDFMELVMGTAEEAHEQAENTSELDDIAKLLAEVSDTIDVKAVLEALGRFKNEK